MGYLKAVETDELRLPSDQAYWVRMKGRAAYGDSSAAQAAMIHTSLTGIAAANSQNGNKQLDEAETSAQVLSESETDAYMQKLVARLVVEWNLTDAQDRPLPISAASVALLNPEDGEFLALEAEKRRGGRPAAQQGPFAKRSGRRSTATKSRIPKSSE
jgi:hypothetical protein